MRDLARGAGDVTAGYRFLVAHPRLWGWVAAPAAVTLVLLVAAVWGVAALASPLVDRATDWMPAAIEGWGRGLVWVIVVVALGLGAALAFVSVAGLVAGPFNELLSEAVERQLTGAPGPRFSLAAFVRGVVTGLAHAVRRLLAFLIGAVIVFGIAFVPVVGTIAAAVLGFWLAARAAAYDCYDAVLARRDLGYRAKLDYLGRHRSRTFGLGAAVAGLLLVPGINLVALGLGATGATLAARELDALDAAAPTASTASTAPAR